MVNVEDFGQGSGVNAGVMRLHRGSAMSRGAEGSRRAREALRIVVLGYLVRGPLGGLAWHHLQYVMGLARLGHDVHFLEDSDDYPSCYDPTTHTVGTDPSHGLRFAEKTFERVGLSGGWSYYNAHEGHWLGPAASRIGEVCAGADLLLNVSGVNPVRPWFERVPIRVLVDTDPAFTQIRHLRDPDRRALAEAHTHFFSFGENIGRPGCTVPDDGCPWLPTRQPIVLDAWPVTRGPRTGLLTTVLQWDSYPAEEHAGRRYGMKSDSFRDYDDLPARAGRRFELALGSSSSTVRARLRAKGWRLRDPDGPARDPWSYQRHIRRSKAEFSVAKQGYVVSRSGWFSERSACYLASGRPVLVQDTGFSDWLPTGSGVLSFATPDQALAGIESLDESYDEHCRAAREIAAEYFDASSVLGALVSSCGASVEGGARDRAEEVV